MEAATRPDLEAHPGRARVTVVLASYGVLGGASALAGWWLDVPSLTNWGGRISIQPIAALGVLVLGCAAIAAIAGREASGAALGSLAAVIGTISLAENLLGFDVGFDSLLLPVRSWGHVATVAPGRMGPVCSLGLALLGSAWVARSFGGARVRTWVGALAIGVVALVALPLIGYVMGADPLYQLARFTAIASQTATYLLALAVAALASVPEREPVRSLLDDSTASVVARRALPFLVLAPVALGFVSVRGHQAGAFDAAMGTAVLVLTLIGMLTTVLWWSVTGARAHALALAEEARARSDAALRELESRAGEVLEGISDGFVAFDRAWRFIYLNGVAQRVFDRQGAPLVERELWEAVPELLGSGLERALRRVARARTTAEHAHQTRDGRWFGCRIYPAVDGGVSVHFRDVTEQRRAEERAFKGEQQASVLMSVLPGGAAFVVDRELRYLLANGEALADEGLMPSDFIGKTLAEALPPEQAALHEPRYRAALAGEPFVHEHERRGRTYLTRGVPLRDQGGQIYGVLALSHDITEHKRVEIALRDGDRRKDEFVATLAHELRNPLAPIANALEILKHPDVDPSMRKRLEDSMRRQVAHVVRLVDDLLDVSRITRNRLTLRREPIDLVRVVSDALDVCRTMIDRVGHELIVTLPVAPITLFGDGVRLAQVVGNLVANAVKYTEKPGRISVTVARDGEAHATITVADTGIGIPAEMLSSVFELFVQADRSLERVQEGLGIGLALAKRLVEMHGGTISAASEGPGMGSELVARLPVMDELRVGDDDRASRPAAPLAVRRILVVDDNREAADSLAELLRLMGRDTAVAYDGIEAVEAVSRFEPDAVLLDIGLPRLNGYDACRAIRTLPSGNDVVIVAVTGWGQEQDQRRAREAGFDSHLVKPVDPEVLSAAIASAVEARAGARRAD